MNAAAIIKQLCDALEWYAHEARACEKGSHSASRSNALLASVTVLALDGGKRADAAIAAADECEAQMQPLADEQIEQIRQQCIGLNSGELYAALFARHIERAHGIGAKE